MSPVDSDPFDPADYAATFGILDAVPGLTMVNNYSGLTALNWGTNQHGSPVLQRDNGALWWWDNPSGSGTWKRLNSIGLIDRSVQSADVSTSAVSGNGVKVVQTGNLTIPGGRAIHINVLMGLDNDVNPNSMVAIHLLDNGSTLTSAGYRAGEKWFDNGNVNMLDWYIEDPTPNSVHNYAVYVRATGATQSAGGGGTASARSSVITVSEV